jgi:hypothetical protein
MPKQMGRRLPGNNNLPLPPPHIVLSCHAMGLSCIPELVVNEELALLGLTLLLEARLPLVSPRLLLPASSLSTRAKVIPRANPQSSPRVGDIRYAVALHQLVVNGYDLLLVLHEIARPWFAVFDPVEAGVAWYHNVIPHLMETFATARRRTPAYPSTGPAASSSKYLQGQCAAHMTHARTRPPGPQYPATGNHATN